MIKMKKSNKRYLGIVVALMPLVATIVLSGLIDLDSMLVTFYLVPCVYLFGLIGHLIYEYYDEPREDHW